MTALSIIIDIVLILISIVLIVTVLMQEGQRQGLGAIGGGAETFFGKNKAKSMEGRLQKYTKIAAVAFIVLAIAATVISAHNTGSPVSVNDVIVEDAADEAEATTDEAAAAVEDAGRGRPRPGRPPGPGRRLCPERGVPGEAADCGYV